MIYAFNYVADTTTTNTNAAAAATLGFAKNLFPPYNASSLFTSAN